MSNPAHLGILQQGVPIWNAWRLKNVQYDGRPVLWADPDLQQLDGEFLKKFDFSRFIQAYYPHPGEIADLYAAFKAGELDPALVRHGWFTLDGINLWTAKLSGADLHEVSIRDADLRMADLSGANLESCDFSNTNFQLANLTGARLRGVNLSGANLTGANLSNSDLTHAKLTCSVMVGTNLHGADLSESSVYGVAAWGVDLSATRQRNLVITPQGEPAITIDDLEVAQFVYLMLRNEKIRAVIDSISSKAVLILGRFTNERKAVLDALREELRRRNYLPILFDFEKPVSRDLTETISTLAHMARFVVADITDAKSIPQELLRIVPNLPSVPVQPIMLTSQTEYSMFEHFRRYPWVLPEFLYRDSAELTLNLVGGVIEPAERKVREMAVGC